MKAKLYYCEHADCQVCTESISQNFQYIETKKGEKHVFELVDTYTIAFILSGEALVTCNEFVDVVFRKDEIVLWPMNSSCAWESLTATSAIVITGDTELAPCDKKALKEHADLWLSADPEFKGLPIKPRLKEFLYSVKNYLGDGIKCPHMYKAKQHELSTIFRAYYSPKELMDFFIPTVQNTYEFELFVMSNYLQMKGLKEFVDSSGMNLAAFNRKFKAHFKESPYQWLIKQRSKHIFHDIASTDKNFASIAKEYHFTDASHFNRYCKSHFGDSPSKIRDNSSVRQE